MNIGPLQRETPQQTNLIDTPTSSYIYLPPNINIMVWNRIRDAVSGTPTLEGPSKLPEYFPVEPRGK